MNGTAVGTFTLQVENANLRSRCEKLNAMCIELATDYAKAEAERDEARQWARYYKRLYEKVASRWNVRECFHSTQLAEARNNALDEAGGRAIIGALKSAIDAHGPIDKTRITSAAKRILGALKDNS